MNTKLKTFKTAMLTAAVALMTATAARADANPANDTGSFTVRITPNVDLGVTVDTAGSNWTGAANLDMTSNLGTDTLLQVPIGIAMAGNFSNQELTLTGAALNTWQLDTDEVDVMDQVRLYALFAKDASAAPAIGDFAGTANLIVTSAGLAGQIPANEGGDTGHKYELATGHLQYADVDGMPSTAIRDLWLRARTPSETSTADQAAFTVTVTAVSGVAQ